MSSTTRSTTAGSSPSAMTPWRHWWRSQKYCSTSSATTAPTISWAQSTKYPPVPVDKDREKQRKELLERIKDAEMTAELFCTVMNRWRMMESAYMTIGDSMVATG